MIADQYFQCILDTVNIIVDYNLYPTVLPHRSRPRPGRGKACPRVARGLANHGDFYGARMGMSPKYGDFMWFMGNLWEYTGYLWLFRQTSEMESLVPVWYLDFFVGNYPIVDPHSTRVSMENRADIMILDGHVDGVKVRSQTCEWDDELTPRIYRMGWTTNRLW